MSLIDSGQSRAFFTMMAGVLLLIVGFLLIIPKNGPLGLVIVTIGGAVSGYGASHLLHKKEASQAGAPLEDIEARLRRLNSLKEEGLITEEEYAEKRKQILAEKW